MKASLAAVLLAVAAACAAPALGHAQNPTPAPAPAPAPAGEVDPVGRYEFSTLVNGSPMKGTIAISGAPGAYTGSLTSDIFPVMNITRVAVTGQTLTFVAEAPDGPVDITLTFVGDDFTGRWALGPQSGDITGKRLPPQ